ncbi:hypothetical protein [Siphonobacter sp. SORGH_AS_0500]|uniref:hypothetical protein n=1 Tax=Siphonobacter sp. SORGH_AS_0500 TaxID=1864824 RepID=UPI0012FE8452|nr:hypothetical protein [Siphonobacter sp. SORGH_AS_0500]
MFDHPAATGRLNVKAADGVTIDNDYQIAYNEIVACMEDEEDGPGYLYVAMKGEIGIIK